MTIEVSSSITFENIEFNHTHPCDEGGGEFQHTHIADVTLTFNAKAVGHDHASAPKLSIPISSGVLGAVKEQLVACANEVLHGNFEESAVKILERINTWLPTLKEQGMSRANSYLSNVSIAVYSASEAETNNVRHADLEALGASKLIYACKYTPDG